MRIVRLVIKIKSEKLKESKRKAYLRSSMKWRWYSSYLSSISFLSNSARRTLM